MSVLSPDNPSTSLGLPRLPNFLKEINNASFDENITINWFDESSYIPENLIFNENTSVAKIFFGSPAHKHIRNFCKQILVERITDNYSIRYWDVAILIPNLMFLIFLIFKSGMGFGKSLNSRSPILSIFFILVFFTTIFNIIRCFASMTVGATNQVGEIVDKILWLILKFVLLSAELCVLAFGLLLGHIDKHSSIKYVIFTTLLISFIHLSLQTVLEFVIKDEHYFVEDPTAFNLYAHGGMGFWMASSGVFVLVYSFACLLPYSCLGRLLILPVKCTFYAYCLILAVLNAAQMIGAALIFADCLDGMCIVDLTTFIYFTLFTPFVYFSFLRRPLCSSASNGGGPLFSYRKQKDEAVAGDLPHASTYYPRFSGLTSPSYDDLFDYDSMNRNRYHIDTITETDYRHNADLDLIRSNDPYNYDVPLLMSQRTPDSTVTTHVDFDYSPDFDIRANILDDRVIAMKPSQYDVGSTNSFGTGPRKLKGLGPNGTLIFSEDNEKIVENTGIM